MELIPLFPLGLVLLPAMPLPLHIFEERYKEMMEAVIPDKAEFGVALAREQGIVSVGCTATVERVIRRYDDGRLDVLATGQRRFEVESLDQELNYLRAQVRFFNDEDAAEAPPGLRERAEAAFQLLIALDEPEGSSRQLSWDRGRASFQLARYIEDLDKRQTVLGLRSEVARLEFLVRAIPEYAEQKRRAALAKRVGPLNGHAKMGR